MHVASSTIGIVRSRTIITGLTIDEMERRINLVTVLESAGWHLGFMNASITSLICSSPSGSRLLPKPSCNYEKNHYEKNILLEKHQNQLTA